MSTKGLFIPLSVIQGDTLDVAFDITLEEVQIDPNDITLEGQFIRSDFSADAYPETFTFQVSEVDAYKMHARVSSDVTEGLLIGNYNYQIRFIHNTDLSLDVDSTGDKTTILYGSLTVLESPLFR